MNIDFKNYQLLKATFTTSLKCSETYRTCMCPLWTCTCSCETIILHQRCSTTLKHIFHILVVFQSLLGVQSSWAFLLKQSGGSGPIKRSGRWFSEEKRGFGILWNRTGSCWLQERHTWHLLSSGKIPWNWSQCWTPAGWWEPEPQVLFWSVKWNYQVVLDPALLRFIYFGCELNLRRLSDSGCVTKSPDDGPLNITGPGF